MWLNTKCNITNEMSVYERHLQLQTKSAHRNVAISLSTELSVMYNDKKRPSAQIYSQGLNAPFGA